MTPQQEHEARNKAQIHLYRLDEQEFRLQSDMAQKQIALAHVRAEKQAIIERFNRVPEGA